MSRTAAPAHAAAVARALLMTVPAVAVGYRPRAAQGERELPEQVEEAYAFLVGAPVFKTGEGEHLVLAGSIPVRLRHAV